MANQTIDTLSIKISATSSSAVKNLQNTAKAVKQVGNASNGAIPKMKKLDGSVLGLARSFGKFYASCFLLIRGIKALGRAIGKSMNYIETFNYLNVTLDKVSKESQSNFQEWGYDSAEEYANSFAKRLNELTEKMTGFSVGENGMLSQSDVYRGLGLDPNKLMNFQAQIMQLTNSVGVLGETSVNTTKALSMLASDLSSFTNRDIEQVMGNLQSGLIGQSRALYKYGIDITQAALEQEALAQGLSKSVSEMSQQEKMQLRLLVILRNSRVAWGDQANTINSVANQYRILKEQASNLARIIGNVLMPVVQVVLPYVNALILSLQKFFTFIGNALYGEDWKGIMDGISSGVGDIDVGVDDMGDGLEDANTSAKKLKKTLLGFDELNVISSDSSGSTGLFSDGIDLSKQIAEAVSEYEKLWNDALEKSKNKANDIANSVEKQFKRVFGNIGNGFNSTFDSSNIGQLADNVTRISESASRVINNPKVQQSLQNLQTTAETTIGKVVGATTELGKNIAIGVTGGVADASESLEGFNREKLLSINNSITKIGETFGDLADKFADVSKVFAGDDFQKLISFFTKIVDMTFLSGLDKFVGYTKDFINFFVKPFTDNSSEIKELFANIVENLSLVFSQFDKLFNLLDEYNGKWENSIIHKMIEELTSRNSEKFKAFLDYANTSLEFFNMLLDLIFNHDIDAFKNKFVDLISSIKERLNDLWENSSLKKIIEFFNMIFNGGWNGTQLIQLGRSGQSGGYKKFAVGGFPAEEDGWFRASHGELIGQFDNGQSVVANNQQIIAGIKQGVYEAVSSAMGNGETVIQIDGKEVFRATQSYASEYKRTTGRNAF